MELEFTINPLVKSEYVNFMEDYVKTGVLKVVSKDKIGENSNFVHYYPESIPEYSTTQKNDLSMLLLRFRKYQYGIFSNITELCNNESYPRNQKQVIVWRNQPQDELCYYEVQNYNHRTSSTLYSTIETLHNCILENQNNKIVI